jgi:hypothetical protein
MLNETTDTTLFRAVTTTERNVSKQPVFLGPIVET